MHNYRYEDIFMTTYKPSKLGQTGLISALLSELSGGLCMQDCKSLH